ncbi:hypothetical protein AYI68_g3000 [Smittium mucronatum]|uniref:Chitin-binding type-4 domain-containing protein n=1 Tax=Smittium mucronatum TaxID=133383 RepID=A0A1R0H176_9FUNG|nr:hypothetical protein AYI68_g3000 [Smittium mucronatum]
MMLPQLLLLSLASLCAGHGMLKYPQSRGNAQWYGTCSAGAGCKGPCDSPRSNSPANSIYYTPETVQRGQQITIKWDRLNHPGGFVRLAMTTFDQSDDWESFNNNVSKYVCYESNCGPDASEPNAFGTLTGPGDGECSTSFTIPSDLPDGLITLQWVWFGGGIYYGEQDTSFGEYYGCSDMKLSGGVFENSTASAYFYSGQAQFQGGDIMYPNEDVCRYWGSNKVGDCNFPGQYPSPVDGDLLSQSLEPCYRNVQPQKGKPAGY